MFKNWKITAFLQSPFCGQPPKLDGLLAWELSLRLGDKKQKKITRHTPLREIPSIGLPIKTVTISGIDLSRCSDPVTEEPEVEWQERVAKRFDTSRNSLVLHETQRKSLLVTSGPYKQRFTPVSLSKIHRIVWFVNGDKRKINKLLKRVVSIGKCRKIGYGLIDFFDYEEVDDDFSIYAESSKGKVLMKTVPNVIAKKLGCIGYSSSYGSYTHPYWHPENFTEIAIPC